QKLRYSAKFKASNLFENLIKKRAEPWT
ncbi:MAG: hypothetical protein ACI8PD_001741, partial [Nitrospinales bacterium]